MKFIIHKSLQLVVNEEKALPCEDAIFLSLFFNKTDKKK